MKTNFTKLSLITATLLTLGSTSLQAENLIQNGSFEEYEAYADHGRWKEVTLSHWSGNAEIWNSKIGKAATQGGHKIELDLRREVDELSQIVTTVAGKTYKLSLDAYARRWNSSDFEILVDGEVQATFRPDRKWAEFNVYFTGTGEQQVISIKELDSQNNGLGTIIDNVKLEESAELLKNGSFEHYTINRNHGRWKEVTFDAWEGKGEVWTNRLGKRSTNGVRKIELDVGREFNVLSQTVTTQERKEYAISLDAYARRAKSSDFEIWVDDTKLETIRPSKTWENYKVTFFGNGKAQKIQIKEIEAQSNGLGTVIDNISMVETGKFDNRPPSITGEAKQSVSLYNTYTFSPIGTDVDNDTLMYGIENKPAWAEFNTSTGVLSGTAVSIGLSTDIKITVTDGRLSTVLAPFSIEVSEAVDIAQQYGKATQAPKNGYYWYGSPTKMIDGDKSTFNHTQGTTTENWVQIELPSPTAIHSIMVQGRESAAWRLNGAKVYVSNTPYNGTVDESQALATLAGNSNRQNIELSDAKVGTYLIIKGKNAQHLHISSIEVYGAMPKAPKFISSDYVTSTSKWMNKTESIFNVKATDYQNDVLSYSLEGEAPFNIDDNGDIRVTGILTEASYTFDVMVSDGLNSAKQSMTVSISDATTVDKTFRSNDSKPTLSGYVPNTYVDGDTLMVTVAGVSYEATVYADGTWTVDSEQIEAPITVGTHDVSLSVNGAEAIVYADYFEVYSSMLQASTHSLSMETLADVEVTVNASTHTPLEKDERVRGSSIWLKVENGQVILENKSYREIKSLLGKYEDENGKEVLVKLNFNENLLPYTSNVLSNFSNAQNMQIVQTAGHFDMELSFGGKDCNTDTSTEKTIYCTPTTKNDEIYSDRSAQNNTDLSEQQVYSVAMATYSHLYNSVDGLNAMKAWVEGTTYKGLDYTGSYQSSESYTEFEDDKLAYLNEKYFRVTMPNNHVKYSSMRFQYAAEGMGGGRSGNILGTKSGGHFASSWEGSIKYDNNRLSTYDTIHHELAHAIGFGHSSGMSYGWSHALKQVVSNFYNVGENPIVDVPNYVFETKVVGENEIQLTIHKTSDANEDEVNIEILSGTAVMNGQYSVEQGNNDENNQVTLNMNLGNLTRFFIRVHGADSDELMSKMMTPSMMTRTLLATDSNASKEYHIISPSNWVKGAKALNLPLKSNETQPICKLFLGTDAGIAYQVDADKINSDFRTEMDAADWLDSKKMIARRSVWYQYLAYDYSDGAYTTAWKNYNQLVNDDELAILCVKPVK